MVSLCHPIRTRTCGQIARRNTPKVFCSVETPPSQSTIKVVIVGATKEIGRTAIVAVNKARGMELAGAIDSQCIGEDAGQVLALQPSFSVLFPLHLSICLFHSEDAAGVLNRRLFVNSGIALQISGMEEALEIPVLNDLTMVLGSIAQSRATGVVVDFSEPSTVYDNVKQVCQLSTIKNVMIRIHELSQEHAMPLRWQGLAAATHSFRSSPGDNPFAECFHFIAAPDDGGGLATGTSDPANRVLQNLPSPQGHSSQSQGPNYAARGSDRARKADHVGKLGSPALPFRRKSRHEQAQPIRSRDLILD